MATISTLSTCALLCVPPAAAQQVPTASLRTSPVPVLPRLELGDLEYAGAFRLPAGIFGASDLNFAEGPFTYDPDSHSIYIVGHTHQQAIAEFSVPPLSLSPTLSGLQMAPAPLQDFVTIIDRAPDGNPQLLDRIGGLYIADGPAGKQLIVQCYEYYDASADNSQTTLVVRDAHNLASSAVDGGYSLQGAAHVSGWISSVPAPWQSALGGEMLAGHSSGIPIISRCSVGPTAFALDLSALTGGSPPAGTIPAVPLLDFSLASPLESDLFNSSGSNAVWTHLSAAEYGFIAPGTSTYVTIGRSGGHNSGVCYKCEQDNGLECGGYCTPIISDNYPYYWLWDVNDLVAVERGRRLPSDVRSYDYGVFPTPFDTAAISGGSFDPASKRLYLSLDLADNEQGIYSNPPVIVAYDLR